MTDDRYTERTVGTIREMEKVSTLQRSVCVRFFICVLDMVTTSCRKSVYKGEARGFLQSYICGDNYSWVFIYFLFRRDRFIAVDQCETRFTNDRKGERR